MNNVIYLSVKEDSAPAPKVASFLLKKLIEEKEEQINIRFILTDSNYGMLSEKLLAVLRVAADMINKEDSYFYNLLNSRKMTLRCSLPVTKNIKSEKEGIDKKSINNGYENFIRVQEITVRLEEAKEDLDYDSLPIINLSLKEDSKNAGQVASRIIRTLIKDEKDKCALRFVLSENNHENMSKKVLSLKKIMGRMLKDPATMIDTDLPLKVKYEITFTAPILKKILPINSDSNNVNQNYILTHEIVFSAK